MSPLRTPKPLAIVGMSDGMKSQLPSPNPWSQNERHLDELKLICFNQILFGGIFLLVGFFGNECLPTPKPTPKGFQQVVDGLQ